MDNPLDRDEDEVCAVTGLYCFLNAERACGPDCMAYMAPVPEGPDYRAPDGYSNQWAHCMELVNMHKIGKHIIHLVAKSDESVKLAKSMLADHQRNPPTLVPSPFPVFGITPNPGSKP